MLIVVDEGRDYHAETQAFFARMDRMRRDAGLPRILHNNTRYIQGKIKDTETGITHMVMCPPNGSAEWDLLVGCWWNGDARGGIKKGEDKSSPPFDGPSHPVTSVSPPEGE